MESSDWMMKLTGIKPRPTGQAVRQVLVLHVVEGSEAQRKLRVRAYLEHLCREIQGLSRHGNN